MALQGDRHNAGAPPTVRRAAHHGLSSPLLVPGTSQPLGPPRRAMLLHEEPGAPAISAAETGTPPQVSSTSSLC